MNRVSIVYLFAVLWLLVSPSLTAPADNEVAKQVDASQNGSPEIEQEPPNASKNEIAGNLDDDVEDIKPEKGETTNVDADDKPAVSGMSTGIITRIGVDGPFECKTITCPDGTETCKFTSKFSPDGKRAEVHYQCFSSNGTALSDETKTEDASDAGVIGIDGVFSDFTRRMNAFLDEILKSFQF